MTAQMRAEILVPLGSASVVRFVLDIPNTAALTPREEALVTEAFSLILGFVCDQFTSTAPAEPVAPLEDTETAVSTTGPQDRPMVCPIEPCTFKPSSEQGLVVHLSTTHALRGTKPKQYRQELVALARARAAGAPEPETHPPADRRSTPAPPPAPEVDEEARAPVDVLPPERPEEHAAVAWPTAPMGKHPFDADRARARAVEQGLGGL